MEQESKPRLDANVRTLFDPGPADALEVWCDNRPCTIDFDRSLPMGLTNARLAVVSVQDENGSRNVVLKHCPAHPYEKSLDFNAFTAASESGPPGFAEAHLVKLDDGISHPIPDGHGGQFIVIEDLSPKAHFHYNSLADLLKRSALGTACQSIMPQILIEWNKESPLPIHDRDEMTAQKFLREVLGTRCDPDGHLHGAIKALTESEQDLRWPLAAVTSGEGLSQVKMKGLRGNAHGDLHPDNVFFLLPNGVKPSVQDYKNFKLIDLTTFKKTRLLAVDPAHLTMSIIARLLPGLSTAAVTCLASFVLNPDEVDPAGIPGELTEAIKAIHAAGINFSDPRGYCDTWRLERLTAIAACALLFVGRVEDAGHQLWFLRLAIETLRRLSKSSPDPEDSPAGRAHLPGDQGVSRPQEDQVDDKPNLRLLQGGASSSGSAPADDPPETPCTDLVRELISEIKTFRNQLSPGSAKTATTTARIIAEELSIALDAPERQSTAPRANQITALGITRATLNEVRANLHSMAVHGVDPKRLRNLSIKAAQLLRQASELEQTGSSSQSPGPQTWPTNLL